MKKETIKNFPISFFAIILGMNGFTIALQKIRQIFNIDFQLDIYFLFLTLFVFIFISIIYGLKIFLFKEEIIKEFHHPIKINFFPAFSISFILFATAFLSLNLFLSKVFWIIGVIINFIFTIKIISIWIQHTKFEIKHMNPAWFIPTVGNVIIPIAGVEHFNNEVSWFFCSIGLFFWIILLVIFFNRIIFHDPLPEKLLPTFFILLAPPAVGFISIVKLTGETGVFAKLLYYFALFLFFLLFAQIKLFKNIKNYYLSWWAYSFPLAAITIASVLMFHKTGYLFFKFISLLLFIVLTFVIFLLIYKTIIAIINNKICIEEK